MRDAPARWLTRREAAGHATCGPAVAGEPCGDRCPRARRVRAGRRTRASDGRVRALRRASRSGGRRPPGRPAPAARRAARRPRPGTSPWLPAPSSNSSVTVTSVAAPRLATANVGACLASAARARRRPAASAPTRGHAPSAGARATSAGLRDAAPRHRRAGLGDVERALDDDRRAVEARDLRRDLGRRQAPAPRDRPRWSRGCAPAPCGCGRSGGTPSRRQVADLDRRLGVAGVQHEVEQLERRRRRRAGQGPRRRRLVDGGSDARRPTGRIEEQHADRARPGDPTRGPSRTRCRRARARCSDRGFGATAPERRPAARSVVPSARDEGQQHARVGPSSGLAIASCVCIWALSMPSAR